MDDYLAVIRNGIGKVSEGGLRKKVIIVGGGMAGLVAAYELKRAGHQPIILEAQRRLGGRVYTLRDPFMEGLYAEVGAMRIPRAHKLTLEYIEKFGLKTHDFTMDNPQAYYYIGGRKMCIADVDADPSLLGFEVGSQEAGLTAGKLWLKCIQPLIDHLQGGGEAAWDEIVQKYDQYSTREFLELNNWSEGAIEMYGLLANQEAVMNSSFLELFREDAGNYYTNMVEIEGGTDRLPYAFLPDLRENIRFGARMIALDQSPENVTVHYQTRSGKIPGNRRLCHYHRAVSSSSARGSSETIFASQAACHTPTAL